MKSFLTNELKSEKSDIFFSERCSSNVQHSSAQIERNTNLGKLTNETRSVVSEIMSNDIVSIAILIFVNASLVAGNVKTMATI